MTGFLVVGFFTDLLCFADFFEEVVAIFFLGATFLAAVFFNARFETVVFFCGLADFLTDVLGACFFEAMEVRRTKGIF